MEPVYKEKKTDTGHALVGRSGTQEPAHELGPYAFHSPRNSGQEISTCANFQVAGATTTTAAAKALSLLQAVRLLLLLAPVQGPSDGLWQRESS